MIETVAYRLHGVTVTGSLGIRLHQLATLKHQYQLSIFSLDHGASDQMENATEFGGERCQVPLLKNYKIRQRRGYPPSICGGEVDHKQEHPELMAGQRTCFCHVVGRMVEMSWLSWRHQFEIRQITAHATLYHHNQLRTFIFKYDIPQSSR